MQSDVITYLKDEMQEQHSSADIKKITWNSKSLFVDQCKICSMKTIYWSDEHNFFPMASKFLWLPVSVMVSEAYGNHL